MKQVKHNQKIKDKDLVNVAGGGALSIKSSAVGGVSKDTDLSGGTKTAATTSTSVPTSPTIAKR